MTTQSQKQKSKNVPELRFSGFDGEWENKHLNSVYKKITNGFVGTATPFYVNDLALGVKYLQGKNVKNGQLNNKELVFISNEFNNKHKKSELKAGDLLMVQSGHVGECAVVDEEYAGSNCHAVLILSPKSEAVDSRFVKSLFYADTGKKAVTKITTGNTIRHILASDMAKMSVLMPHLIEQQKIADFLDSVDAWLDNLRQQKTALESYKRGMMQKLFTQQVRFKDSAGNDFPAWEERELGEMLDYKQPTEFIVESTEYNDDYDTPVLTAGKTFVLGYTNETKGIFHYELPVIIFDDFTTATKFVDFKFKVKSSAMKILVPLDNNNVRFIYEAMQNIRFEVGGHGRQWISKYSKLTVAIPCPEEQNKIADFATALNKSIENKAIEITKVEEWKKGLMQKMFV